MSENNEEFKIPDIPVNEEEEDIMETEEQEDIFDTSKDRIEQIYQEAKEKIKDYQYGYYGNTGLYESEIGVYRHCGESECRKVLDFEPPDRHEARDCLEQAADDAHAHHGRVDGERDAARVHRHAGSHQAEKLPRRLYGEERHAVRRGRGRLPARRGGTHEDFKSRRGACRAV